MFNQFLFKNRWIALAFVVFTLLTVYTLVGTEDDASVLAGIAAQQQQDQAELAAVEAPPQPDYQADQGLADYAEDAYLSDEELIDPATGIDPTPMDGAEGAVTDPEAQDKGDEAPIEPPDDSAPY